MKFNINCSTWDPYQTLLAQQTEQHGVAHFPQVLETHGLELSVLNYVFQLVVKEFQDSWKEIQFLISLLINVNHAS